MMRKALLRCSVDDSAINSDMRHGSRVRLSMYLDAGEPIRVKAGWRTRDRR